MFFKYLLIIFCFLLSSCVDNFENKILLTAESLNKYWKVYYYNPLVLYEKTFDMYAFSDKLKDVRIRIYTYNTNYKLLNCTTSFSIEFLKITEKNNQEIKDVNLKLDNNKIFFAKNNENYYLKFYGSTLPKTIKNNKISISTEILNQKNINIIYNFNSPIGCQALEGSILEIGGIYLNGKELEPIRIKLSYKNNDTKPQN